MHIDHECGIVRMHMYRKRLFEHLSFLIDRRGLDSNAALAHNAVVLRVENELHVLGFENNKLLRG